MRKKGQLPLKAAIELVVAITIFLLFIYVGRTWGDGEVFQKARAAKETALIMDSLYASDGNSYITYPVNMSKFIFKFEGDKVTVSSSKRIPDPTEASYRFIAGANNYINKKIENPKKLVFAKLGNEISILDKEPNLNKVIYEVIETKDNSNKRILLDISEDTINEPEKLAKAKTIVEALKVQFKDVHITKRAKGARIDAPVSTEADILISIAIGSYNDERNTINSYYQVGGEEKKKRKFAGIIINNLLEKDLNLDGANVIPSDSLTDLNNAGIRILLEIGNINSKKSLEMLDSKTGEIADSIAKSITDYYK